MAEAVRVSSGTLSVENGVANFVNVKIQLSGVSNTSVHKIVIPGKENMSYQLTKNINEKPWEVSDLHV